MRLVSSSTASPHQRRACRCRRRGRWYAGFVFCSALKLDNPNSIVQSFLVPIQRAGKAAGTNRRIQPMESLPPLLPRTSAQLHHLQPHHSDVTSSSSSSTALHLFFDRFLHPYGVSNQTDDSKEEDDLNESSIELLNALLPRLQTKEEKMEGFQRARLDEQLRLMKRSKRGGEESEEETHFLADDDDEVSRMTDLFQRARLAEQLRLSQNGVGVQNYSNQSTNNIDRDEAFQRALLEERLKIGQLQLQRDGFVSTPGSIENAFLEYENEKKEEHKALRTMTMVQEGEEMKIGADIVYGESGNKSEDVSDALVLSESLGGGDNTVGDTKMSANQSDDAPLIQLKEKLEGLHQMVDIATTSPSADKPTTKNTASTLQNFLSTTHLPLPPREDASLFSLALAPMAHLVTSLFLLGTACFYAVVAVLDVLLNDNQDEHSTRACLKEASTVLPTCLDYVLPANGKQMRRSALRRTLRAMQTSCIASFYAIKCILFRAAKQSKYADEFFDAGAGAVRYLLYALRSLSVLWNRTVDSLIGSFRDKGRLGQNKNIASPVPTAKKRKHLQGWKHKLNPLRLFSKVTSTTAQRLDRQSSLQDGQQRLRSDELYSKKMRLLNLDRVALERDRQELLEAQRQLEVERRKLLNEGVNVLAWYSAAMEADAATDEAGKQESQKPQKKERRWSLW